MNPVYLAGQKGTPEIDFGDSPDKSQLFQMLFALSQKLKENGVESHRYEWWYDFNDWQSFCKFVVTAYKK